MAQTPCLNAVAIGGWVPQNPSSLARVDFRDDELDDLLFTDQGSSTVAIQQADDQGLGPVHLVGRWTAPLDAALADLDEDGDDDVVVLDEDGNLGLLRQDAGVWVPSLLHTGLQTPLQVEVIDLDDDGRMDVAVVEAGTGTVLGFQGMGGGQLSAPVPLVDGLTGLVSMAWQDDDADDLPELVIGTQSHHIARCDTVPGGGVSVPWTLVAEPGGLDLHWFDGNGDGTLDILARNNLDELVFTPLPGGAGALPQRLGTGVQAASAHPGDATRPPTICYAKPTSALCEEFNGFNFVVRGPNLVTPGAWQGLQILDLLPGDSLDVAAFLRYEGAGLGITVGIEEPVPEPWYSPEAQALHGHAVADLDGDGLDDVVVQDALGRSIWTGHADGTLQPTRLDQEQDAPRALADLDQDGHLDLVVEGGVQWGGPAGFDPVSSLSVPTPGVVDMILGDADEDGLIDVLLAENNHLGSATTMALLRNDGARGWTEAALPAYPGQGFTQATLADADGDGHLDLLLADHFGSSIQWAPGLGDGSFAPWSTLIDGVQPSHVQVVDADGDGLTDLLVGAAEGVGIQRNTGGAYTWHPVAPGFEWPYAALGRIALHDVDDDGVLDLLLVRRSAGGGDLEVFLDPLGLPTELPIDTLGLPNVSSFHLADHDGDGLGEVLLWTDEGVLQLTQDCPSPLPEPEVGPVSTWLGGGQPIPDPQVSDDTGTPPLSHGHDDILRGRCGCTGAPGGPGPWALLLVLAALRRRRSGTQSASEL